MDANIEALHEHFAAQSQLPQTLGVVDCVTFVIEGTKVGWGNDHTDAIHYDDRRSAVKQLRRSGGLWESMTEHFGQAKKIEDLTDGDIIWMGSPATLGLLIGPHVFIKGNYTVHQAIRTDDMVGWSTK